jgi:polysaccharide deacetylase family protein (PEP-CTERM system associated)
MAATLRFGPPAITVDVEDWPESSLSSDLPVTARVVVNTERVLGILREARVKTTMFVLGKVAVAFPELLRKIHAEGHEVACHDLGHVPVFQRSREEFEQTLGGCKKLLEDLIQAPVLGYRAPDFSIVKTSLWAMEVLAGLGFKYDSSIFPVRRPRYGIPDWPTHPAQVTFNNGGTIIEVPIGTVRIFNRNWPIGGGGYCRLLPGFLSRFLTRRALDCGPFVFYCHPYEFDPAEFRQINLKVPLKLRLHQGIGRGRFEGRFRRFLREFGGRRICDLLRDRAAAPEDLRLASWSQPR